MCRETLRSQGISVESERAAERGRDNEIVLRLGGVQWMDTEGLLRFGQAPGYRCHSPGTLRGDSGRPVEKMTG